MIGIWLDSFSAFAFGAAIAIPIGIWIGVAHGAQIERIIARLRWRVQVSATMSGPIATYSVRCVRNGQTVMPPKVYRGFRNDARLVLLPLQDDQAGWIINGKLYKSDEQ